MKFERIIFLATGALGALALASCEDVGAGGEPQPQPSETPDVVSPPDVPETPDVPAPLSGAREVTERTDLFVFEYSYPQEAGEIEGVVRWLDGELETERNELAESAAERRRVTRGNGFPFNPLSSGTSWEVVADLPAFLSLSASHSTYMGGAHPNYSFDTMVWDKEADTAIEPIDFFTSAQALDEALGEQLCEALNTERAARRGAPVEEGSDDQFDACIAPDETNLLLGSSNGEAFDRIGIQLAPYQAGPYVEGDYQFTFPVTAELLEVVREEYRGAFAAQ